MTFRPIGEIAAAMISPPENPMPAIGDDSPLRRHAVAEVPVAPADPDLLAIVRRIKRKAEVMRLDAKHGSTAKQDAEEIRLLAEMAERAMGGEHA